MKSSAQVSPLRSGDRDLYGNYSYDVLNNNMSPSSEKVNGKSQINDNDEPLRVNSVDDKISQKILIQPNGTKLLPLRLQPKELGTKIKIKKDPLPMKLRALPSSFWVQPNHLAPESPAPVLPPLTHLDSTKERTSNVPTVVSNANTDLLFSLFHKFENNKKNLNKKRGRPKKNTSVAPSQIRNDDPCLVSTGILPSLSPTRPKPDHPKNVNYSQMLNELVIQL